MSSNQKKNQDDKLKREQKESEMFFFLSNFQCKKKSVEVKIEIASIYHNINEISDVFIL